MNKTEQTCPHCGHHVYAVKIAGAIRLWCNECKVYIDEPEQRPLGYYVEAKSEVNPKTIKRITASAIAFIEYCPDDNRHYIIAITIPAFDGGVNPFTGEDYSETEQEEFIKTGKLPPHSRFNEIPTLDK